MSLEDQNTDRKSLRSLIGRTADWEALARACVCFANLAHNRPYPGPAIGAFGLSGTSVVCNPLFCKGSLLARRNPNRPKLSQMRSFLQMSCSWFDKLTTNGITTNGKLTMGEEISL